MRPIGAAGPGLPEWPPYGEGRTTLVFGAEAVEAARDHRAARLDPIESEDRERILAAVR